MKELHPTKYATLDSAKVVQIPVRHSQLQIQQQLQRRHTLQRTSSKTTLIIKAKSGIASADSFFFSFLLMLLL